MRLRDLLGALPDKTVSGNVSVAIADVVFDSRSVGAGSLFVAVQGTEQDGHRYVADAVLHGAAAVVAEHEVDVTGLPVVVVPNSRRALALLAAAFFGFPARSLRVIGVTGTDGKTTTTTLINSVLAAARRKAGMLSTIKAEYAGRSIETGLHTTTPNPVEVQHHLRDMLAAGVRDVVLETTSHALDQDRTLGCEFDVAVITNVTSDHMDYHGTYGQYLAAKGRLFASLSQSYRKPGVPKVAVTNVDDASYGYLRQFPTDVTITYGIEGKADVMARRVDLGVQTSRFLASTPRGHFAVSLPLPGLYNVYNSLAAIAAALALGLPNDAIVAGLAAIGTLPGRWERVATGEDFTVVIDFAHTPRALEEALRLARRQTSGRVTVVFGCAGARDRMKRPVMGEIAGRAADIVVLTAEDPRTEDVDDIMREIATGCERAGRALGTDYYLIGDRARAIEFAIAAARRGDTVLITGKGHERSLCIGVVEHPWSEHDAVAAALARRRLRQQKAAEEMR